MTFELTYESGNDWMIWTLDGESAVCGGWGRKLGFPQGPCKLEVRPEPFEGAASFRLDVEDPEGYDAPGLMVDGVFVGDHYSVLEFIAREANSYPEGYFKVTA